MIYSELSSDLWAIRLEDGDDILMSLRRFAESKGVRAGLLDGIGSLKKVRLGYYDFESRKYSWQAFEEDMEILNLSGNVSTKDTAYIPHVHVSLGRKDFSTLGGHLDDGSLANMVEVFVRKLPGKLVKAHDEKIGLNVLQLSRKL
jgi:predicted DNA-binding protein with PD1-like motif